MGTGGGAGSDFTLALTLATETSPQVLAVAPLLQEPTSTGVMMVGFGLKMQDGKIPIFQ